MEEIYRSQFRLPYSLYEDLKKSADANRRSVNAELVARLEESFIESSEPKPGRGVDKERLIATAEEDKPVTKRELNDILMEVLNDLRGGPPRPGTPTTGPKPRKKYPKE